MALVGRRRPEVHLDLTALIDVVFILVIFVVLAASFQRVQALSVQLPEAEGGTRADAQGLTVVVPKTGPLFIDGQSVEPERLVQVMLRSGGADRPVLLQIDADAAVQRAVGVLGTLRAAGYSRVGIATREPK